MQPTWGARAWGGPPALVGPPWWRPGLPHPKSPRGQSHPHLAPPRPAPACVLSADKGPLVPLPCRLRSCPRPHVLLPRATAQSPPLCPRGLCPKPPTPSCAHRVCTPSRPHVLYPWICTPSRPLHPVSTESAPQVVHLSWARGFCTPNHSPLLCPQGPYPKSSTPSCAHGVCTPRGPPHPVPDSSSLEPWGQSSNWGSQGVACPSHPCPHPGPEGPGTG